MTFTFNHMNLRVPDIGLFIVLKNSIVNQPPCMIDYEKRTYTDDEIARIVSINAKKLGCTMHDDAAMAMRVPPTRTIPLWTRTRHSGLMNS